MTLTEEQLKVIADYPLSDSLTRFSDKLSHLEGSEDTWRSNVATVLSILVGSSAAFNLHLSDRNSNVAGRLFPIQQKVRGGSLKYDQCRPLIDALAADSPDTDV
ncbi:hypothetical protein MY10362_003929 [Beauveria mimosiformis]